MWGVGEMGEGSQQVQTSSSKISSGDVMHSTVTIGNTVLYLHYLKVAERSENFSTQEKNLTMGGDGCNQT